MFLAHFAVAFAAKRLVPRVSLGVLVMAAQWLDLVWPMLLLGGVERVRIEPGHTAGMPLVFEHYPWSHSLVMALAWGGVFGGVFAAVTRRWRAAAVLALLVPSHWVLDLLVHAPDLPLWPGGPAFGLGLWNVPALAAVLECVALLAGVLLWHRGVRARDRVGVWGVAALLGLLVLIQVGNMAGPPPPSVAAIAWVGLAQWLLVAWAFRLDRHFAPSEGRQ